MSSEFSLQVFEIGRVSPSRELECQQCDFLEGLWEGDEEFEVPVTNWGMRPTQIPKDTVVGKLEVVELVTGRSSVGRAGPTGGCDKQ